MPTDLAFNSFGVISSINPGFTNAYYALISCVQKSQSTIGKAHAQIQMTACSKVANVQTIKNLLFCVKIDMAF
jgi:hypothetical protein